MGNNRDQISTTATGQLPSNTGSIREQVLASIRGSSVTIPDLECLMSHWPQGIHPEIQRLSHHVEEALESIFASPEDGARLQKMKAAKISLFGASWWAYAPFEALKIATQLSIWLFVWDDEVDSLEFSSMIQDFSRASTFRSETVTYLQQSLSRDRRAEASKASSNPVITCFGPVGEAISVCCNDRQIESFLQELLLFIDMCEVEQQQLMTPSLPTVEEYAKRRMGSSAVRVCLAILE
ncbi:isoprenoid synthase domain-containing protein [Hypoxylon sp. FL1284]|nr:isoprenoid synthase domain-containing protein [Hypoxylon sp. FL1284]